MADKKIRNMEEFAEASGLSRPTVSKFFNDPGSVRPTTRARIEEALQRYNYRPNIYAINQNRRLTKTIGIVVPYLADPFFAEIARNIEVRCIAAGYSPSLFSSNGLQEQENDTLDMLRSIKPAGVLLAPLGRRSDRDHVQRFCDDVPTVLFDAHIEGINATFVGSDNFQSVPMLVDYLCRTGEPPCLFEMRNPTNPNANKRRSAYVTAMERQGHKPQIIKVDGDGWRFEDIGYAEGKRVFAQNGFPSRTILCSNDRLAIGLNAAAYEAGIKIGHREGSDYRIAGHDDHPFARFTCPSLTTVSQDYGAIAERSLETLLAYFDDDSDMTTPRETLFEGRLVMRDSA